jgi:hypothetical protein
MYVDASIGVGTRSVLVSVCLAAVFLLQAMVSTSARAEDFAARFGRSTEGSGRAVDHSALGDLLNRYSTTGPDGVVYVDYAGLKGSDHAALKAYIDRLAAMDVAALSRREQFAFWANLYNAKTLDVVVDHYPVESIKDISLGGGVIAAFTGGPWKAKVVTVGGVALSLDDIEHGIMRPIFKDPRVHYAVNCASIGCPNLPRAPLTGEKLEQQLNEAARSYVNHPRGVAVGSDGVIISSIYHWYKADFGGTDEGLLAHLRRYAETPLREKLDAASGIADHRYDWSLNDSSRKP